LALLPKGVFLYPRIRANFWRGYFIKDIKRTNLVKIANIGTSTYAKMNRNETVSLDILVRIALALDCDIGDIVEVVREPK
jgi:DNA-binding Xre family transcriptional regulator